MRFNISPNLIILALMDMFLFPLAIVEMSDVNSHERDAKRKDSLSEESLRSSITSSVACFFVSDSIARNFSSERGISFVVFTKFNLDSGPVTDIG
jgi:hypothetical protein